MSLFKSKEWWSVNLNEPELYDSQCLLVCTIGKDRYQSILLGNHDGTFRIYSPSYGITDATESSGYRATDLLLEMQLPSPVLQMTVASLVSGCTDKNLAILHPKLLVVYSFEKSGTGIGLEMAYHHQLHHSGYSMVAGAFGGGRGRDFVCVQSVDGLLSFYEQESFAFRVYLPEFLLPSPFVYLDGTDSFLFLTSSLSFECYSYENLASFERENGKKLSHHWSYNIGESVMDVKTVASADRLNIVVLTERNLYSIDENGERIFMKRLEFSPMAMHAFATGELKRVIILVATDNYLLNIYEDSCLKWSTRLDQVPVSLDRITLSNLYGGIVLLSEHGYLQCIYLGTHPCIYLLPAVSHPEVNVTETEAELKRLHAEISEKDSSDPEEVDLLGVSLRVESKPTTDGNLKVCRFSVEITNQTAMNKIQIMFATEPPLKTGMKSCLISCSDKMVVDNYGYVEGAGSVSTLEVIVYVSYVNQKGNPFVVEKRGEFPLSLVMSKTNPAKEAKYKMVVAANKSLLPLNVIFRELAGEDGNPNVLGLMYENCESRVTVLAAKTTQRYRLQSDSLESIGPVLKVLVERLKMQFKAASDFNVTYEGTFPLQNCFHEMERYHRLLQRRNGAREKLSRRTCQYRTIQKKVLVNLKDLTPKPISNLTSILTDTYQMITSSVAELEAIEEELELSRCSINSLCSLLIIVAEMMTIAVKDFATIATLFSGHVYDSDHQGWLEWESASATFFLRTILAKCERDQHKSSEITLDPIGSVSKLSKNLSAIFDRVTKGTYLLERSEYEKEKEILSTISGEKDVDDEGDVNLLPEGSKLADLRAAISTVEGRKEKKLTKQERVDSLGTISGWEEEAASCQEKEITEGDERKMDFEEDSIWDVKIEEMPI